MRNEKWWCGENAISKIARANPASLRSAALSRGRGEWGALPVSLPSSSGRGARVMGGAERLASAMRMQSEKSGSYLCYTVRNRQEVSL